MNFKCSGFHLDTQIIDGKVWHIGSLEKGRLLRGQRVKVRLGTAHRIACMQNHTGTHLLNAALHNLLPEGSVTQTSSLVDSKHLKFEFTAMRTSLDPEFIASLEEEVAKMIAQNSPIHRTTIKNPEHFLEDNTKLVDAIRSNARAVQLQSEQHDETNGSENNKDLFDKRAITVQDEDYPANVNLIHTSQSVEPCCGTHVLNSADVQVRFL